MLASEDISDKEQTIIKAQRAYSDFIYHTAWYEFEFMPWIKKVWETSDASNASWLRKWERTLFFTLEYSFKASYAYIIEWAAKASYEEPVMDIYVLLSSNEPIQQSADIKLIKELDNQKLIGITRWGAFTKSIVALSDSDIEIHEIGGNDEVVVSVLMPADQELHYNKMELLYESKVVTDARTSRLVCLLSVNELLPFVKYAKNNAIEVEHVFDY